MKFLHTADLHFGPKAEKLEETIRTTDFILCHVEKNRPDVAILAGDAFDFYDGPIRLDSPAARAAIRFVQGLAELCPVLVVSGTPSHDRGGPEVLREVRGRHPIHVSTEIEMVGLFRTDSGSFWHDLSAETNYSLQAAFTCIPTVDKARLYANGSGSRAEGNAQARELLSDLFGELGKINETLTGVPRFAVGHGMITGAQFSTGQEAVGEDLEYGVSDLLRLGCDYYAWGHVHKYQRFADGCICYSGSPGRLNFGEIEKKGFVLGEIVAGQLETRFVPTPARRFAFKDVAWQGEPGEVLRAVGELVDEGVEGAHVRFRYTMPEEHAGSVDRANLEKTFRDAGAVQVKIEPTILPKVRQRAEGISRLSSLRDKAAKWGETVGEPISEDVLALVAEVETKDTETLAIEALERVNTDPFATNTSTPDYTERIRGALDGFVQRQTGETVQQGLF